MTAPHPRALSRVSDLRYAKDRLAEVYTPDETRAWLFAQHSLLGGERAIALIRGGQGDRVVEVIASLCDSTYS